MNLTNTLRNRACPRTGALTSLALVERRLAVGPPYTITCLIPDYSLGARKVTSGYERTSLRGVVDSNEATCDRYPSSTLRAPMASSKSVLDTLEVDSNDERPVGVLYKVLIIGDSGVGKTALLTRFCEERFQSTFMSTVGERCSRLTSCTGLG